MYANKLAISQSKCKGVSLFLIALLFSFFHQVYAQPITGVWRGRMTQGSGIKQRSAPLEVKLVAQGDSIVGTAYYYGAGKNYIRYSLKGYFGQDYNTVYWKDYYMIDMYPKKAPEAREFEELLKASVDFSCPDGKTMKLDGVARLPGVPEFKLELKKMDNSLFPDEWDEVISGYFMGMARKDVVDSVWQISSEPLLAKTSVAQKAGDGEVARNTTITSIASNTRPVETLPIKPITAPEVEKMEVVTTAAPEKPGAKPTPRPTAPVDITAEIAKSNAQKRQQAPTEKSPPTPEQPATKAAMPSIGPVPGTPPAAVAVLPPQPIAQATMAAAYIERKKVVQSMIPLTGDTLELRFYDNADVDGDSISLFLNGVAMFQHVRLDVRPYIFKIPLENLPEINELTMVAENLGAIPPNTAFMEAFVQGKRYTARLESTEQMSAVIRLVKNE